MENKKHWTDGLETDIYNRLCDCRTIRSDIPALFKAMWKNNENKDLTKSDVLISVFELLDCNNRFFDLSEKEFDDIIKEV